MIGKDFEKIAFNHTIKCLTDKDGNKYLLAEKGGKLSDIIKVVEGPGGEPIPVLRRKWQLNNIRSVGPRFCDITPELTDKWFRFTPVDLSQDGLQMFDMISGDHYLVGTVAVLVKGDKVKVSYKYSIPNVTEKDEYTYFTFFPDYDSVTTVEPEKIENRFEYDVEYSIANDLGGVLRDQQQFPAGTRYDNESLRAAHDVLSGSRVIDASALYYQSSDASDPWGAENRVAQVGSYSFYSESGNHI